MKNLRKLSVLALVLALVFAFTACGGSGGSAEDKTIKVAASPTPHAEILNSAADKLAELETKLKVAERFRKIDYGLESALEALKRKDYQRTEYLLQEMLTIETEEPSDR